MASMFHEALEIIRSKVNNEVSLEAVESWLLEGTNGGVEHAKLDAWSASLGYTNDMNENIFLERVLYPSMDEELAEEVFAIMCDD